MSVLPNTLPASQASSGLSTEYIATCPIITTRQQLWDTLNIVRFLPDTIVHLGSAFIHKGIHCSLARLSTHPDRIRPVRRHMHVSVCVWLLERGSSCLCFHKKAGAWGSIEWAHRSCERKQCLLALQAGSLGGPTKSQVITPNKIKRNIEQLLEALKMSAQASVLAVR